MHTCRTERQKGKFERLPERRKPVVFVDKKTSEGGGGSERAMKKEGPWTRKKMS